jgi:3-oxoacyl-[acyl-carrier-protein] synthase II
MTVSSGWPIVGAGAVSSIGHDRAEMFRRLCAGDSGLDRMRGFRTDWYTADRLYEIDDRGTGGDRAGRATAFLLDAVAEAAAEADLGTDLSAVPVLVGTGLRELRSAELWSRGEATLTPGDLHFGTALRQRFGAVSTHTISNACSASLYALALGWDLLDSGAAEAVVVAGVDSITESMFGIADRLQSVPPDRLRPFDRNRRGTILGEGAAAVVLRRSLPDGTAVLGRLRSVAVNCDAYHVTAPDPRSIAAVIREAHHRAGVAPAAIDLIMLHGTGTHANDDAESAAVREVLGPDATAPLLTALKGMTGHTSGASGLHSLIAACQSMRSGTVPPAVGLDDPIESVAGLRLVRGSAEHDQRLALAQVNSFGFGGINAVAIVEGVR